jgi:hypothetical protein
VQSRHQQQPKAKKIPPAFAGGIFFTNTPKRTHIELFELFITGSIVMEAHIQEMLKAAA